VEQCLNSLDVFKGLIDGLPEKKNRVIRDVIRTMKMGHYEEGEVVYQQGSKATEIYFLLHGSVNACILEQIEQSPEEEPMTEHKEIAVYEKGEGFGEGEFVSKSIRGTTIFVRESPTIVAKLAVHSFEEVIENYRMRVYYHKKDMFMENPLFQLLTPSKLDFILSNTKLVTLTINNSLVQQGESPKSVYVVNKGQLCLFREKTERLPFLWGHHKRGA
jgi:CRP-like cAMP-binding protein